MTFIAARYVWELSASKHEYWFRRRYMVALLVAILAEALLVPSYGRAVSFEIVETDGPSYCPPAEVFKELIPNNRFELDEDNNGVPDYWVPGDTPSVVRQSATGCEALGARGTKALWVTGGSDRGGEWSVHIPEVEPDKYYLVAFQLFRDVFQNGWYPEIELFDKSYIMNQHATFGKWQAIELVLKAPSEATSTTFRFVNHHPCTFWMAAPSLRPFRLAWLKPLYSRGKVGLRWLEPPSTLVYEMTLRVTTSEHGTPQVVRFLNAEAHRASSNSSNRFEHPSEPEVDSESGGLVGTAWIPIETEGEVSAELSSYVMAEKTAHIAMRAKVRDTCAKGKRRDGMPFLETLSIPWRLAEERFPIGIYNVPPDADMKRLVDAGFNTVHLLIPQGNIKLLAIEKIKELPLSWMLDWNPEVDRELHTMNVFNAFKQKIFSWYIADEPELAGVAAVKLYLTRAQAGRRYPAIPTSIAMLRSAAIPYYRFCSDLFFVDPYPIPNQALTWMADALDAAVGVLGPGRSIAVVQAFGGAHYAIQGWERFPTFEEMRVLAFLAITHKASGVFFYDYQFASSRSDYWNTLCRVVRQLKMIEKWLHMPHGTHPVGQWVYSPMGWTQPEPGRAAHYTIKTNGSGSWLLVVVNPDPRPLRIRFEGLPGSDAVLTAVLEHDPAVLKRGMLVDDLAPLEVKAYEYAPP